MCKNFLKNVDRLNCLPSPLKTMLMHGWVNFASPGTTLFWVDGWERGNVVLLYELLSKKFEKCKTS